ncbi:orotidine-5'-phosphate decarboxylase [soil metagenome]
MSGSPQSFGARLAAARDRYGPLCVGIDPHPSLLARAGLDDNATGLASFCDLMMKAVDGAVTAIKPQSAFFERHGSAGIAVLERLLHDAAVDDILTILDAKRGDIGSTMTAYAQAYLSPSSPLGADAVTLSPYLGFESLRPALDLARQHGKGVFVLALTSNPEGATVQHRGVPSVAEHVIESVARCNAEKGATDDDTEEDGATEMGSDEGASEKGVADQVGSMAPLGDIGVVIGASAGAAIDHLSLRSMLSNSTMPVLAPGVGAQGASAADVEQSLRGFTDRVLTPVSRGVLSAGFDVAAINARCAELRTELGSIALGRSGLDERNSTP